MSARSLLLLSCVVAALGGCAPAPSPSLAPPPDAAVPDAAPLAPTRVPVCGEPDVFLEGPAATVCAALDDACVRGVLDDERECCLAEPRARGVTCGEDGAGRCDGEGLCAPAAEITGVEAAAPHDGVIGSEHWIDVAGGGAATLAQLEGAVAIGVGDHTVLEIATAADAPLDLSGVRVVPFDRFGVAGVLGAVARTIDLATDAARVCVTPAGAEAGRVHADCTGGVELSCPGSAGGVSCERIEGGVRVRGEALGLAFALPHPGLSPDAEIQTLGFPLPGFGGGSSCRLGQVQFCTNACGRPSTRYCTVFGNWGACSTPAEVCDGADNDCDGRVDEPTAGMCDDGLSCNVDTCRSFTLSGRTYAFCSHALAPSCAAPDAYCSERVCARERPVIAGRRVEPAGGDASCWAVHDDACEAFIEPESSRGVSQYYPLVDGRSQAAGPAQLGAISGDTTRVQYRTSSRQIPFLFAGDVTSSAPMRALQLPALAAGETERTVSIPAPHGQWRSFRVYDAGMCSARIGWEAFSDQLVGGMIQGIADTRQASGVRLLWAELQPYARTVVDGGQPVDRDRLRARVRFEADEMGALGGAVIGCANVRMTLDLMIELESTDHAWVDVDTADFAAACSGSNGTSDQRRRIREQLLAGIIPTCVAGATFSTEATGRFATTEVAAIRPRHLISGLPVADDGRVLVGLRSLRGQPLGAHDTLARVVSASVSDVSADRCFDGMRDRIAGDVLSGLRKNLPLGFGAGLRSGLTFDPALIFARDDLDAMEIACERDDDCDLRASAGPAFRDPSGRWRGARHRCRERDADAASALDPLLGTIVARRPPGRYCHVALEPRRVQFRPDGLEIVLSDDSSEPQHGMLRESLVGGAALCTAGHGGALGADQAPRVHGDGQPIRLPLSE